MLTLAGCLLITDEDLAARMAWGSESAPEDTGTDRPADTGGMADTDVVPDTGVAADTGTAPGDTASTQDSAPADTDPACAGFLVDPAVVDVDSTAGYAEVTVTLRGCATGITATAPWATAGGGMTVWSTIWTNLPTSVDGEAVATIAYVGDEPTQQPLMSFFASDQGDDDVLTINLY